MITPISGAMPAMPAASPVAPPSASSGFGEALGDAIQNVSDTEHRADNLVQALARGEDVELHQVAIATTEAALSVQLLVAVRDQAVDAYTQIMNMQF